MSSISVNQRIDEALQFSRFPFWVFKKIGEPILLEADWTPAAYPNTKWGIFKDSTGTLTKDTTNLFYGGLASIQMLTAATINDNTELKTNIYHHFKLGELWAFEQKYLQAFAFGATELHVGLEPRDVDIVQGRFKYSIATQKWMYESAADVYSDFDSSIGGQLDQLTPSVSLTAGSKIAWCRVVVDPVRQLYVGFQATGKNGKIETRDMRSLNIPLVRRGAGTGGSTMLVFTLVKAGAAGAEPAFTTDWCVSKIPSGVEPF